GDAWENGPAQRRCDGNTFHDKKHVHQPALLDKSVSRSIKPHDAMKPRVLRASPRQQAPGVVPGSLRGARSSREGPDVALLGHKAERLAEILSHGAGKDDQTVRARGPNHKGLVSREVDGSDIQRCTLRSRNPFLVNAEELRDPLDEM